MNDNISNLISDNILENLTINNAPKIEHNDLISYFLNIYYNNISSCNLYLFLCGLFLFILFLKKINRK